MKRLFAVGLCLFCINACDDSENGGEQDENKTLGFTKLKTFQDVGKTTNQVVLGQDLAYIVASGDNVINVVYLSEWTFASKYIDLGQDANPYAMALDGPSIFIANSINLIASSSIVAPKLLEPILTDENGVNGPTDIYAFKDKIYVTNSEYNMTTYVPEGSILVSNRTGGDVHVYKTALRNPTAFYDFHLDQYEGMVTVFTGEYLMDENYNITGFKDSGIGMTASFDDSLKYETYLLKDVDVGKMAPLMDGKHFVVGTANTPVIHIITVQDNAEEHFKVREMKLPGTQAMYHPVAISKTAVVLANFNADTLYILDASNQAVSSWLSGDDSAYEAAVQAVVSTEYKLSTSSVDRKGPISMAWSDTYKHLFVLNTLSETLDVFKVDAKVDAQ